MLIIRLFFDLELHETLHDKSSMYITFCDSYQYLKI